MRRIRHALALGTVLALIAGGVALARPDNGGPPVFFADLQGENEVDPVETDTSGKAMFRLQGSELHYTLKIKDGVDILAVAGAHIHCGPEGENGPVAAFLAGAMPPLGLDGDIEINATINDESVIPTDCGTNIDQLVQSMRDELAYVNVHSAANPGGEVRGQIRQPGR